MQRLTYPDGEVLSYGYDAVGNILHLHNQVPVPAANQLGGPSQQDFQYDDLYRLSHAQGRFSFHPDKTRRYQLDLAYDSIHNPQSKQQTDVITQPAGTAVSQHKTSYAWAYRYASRPHAPSHIGERSFSYDANGNQTGWQHDHNGTRRSIVWDDEDRIQAICDNGHEKTYVYDDQGQRIIKRGPQGETAYLNQWFTIRNREIGTKHVYAGQSRITSKLMKQDRPGANPQGQTPLEKDQYYYHPDHLGSSSYISDAQGQVYEHLEYFPFGETWVEEASNTQRTPYLFTSKELDEETGLYYFGARYYDPRTSVWQSADPILEKYLPAFNRHISDLGGEGGVYSSPNLALFTYGHNNPLRFIDPDGKEKVQFTRALADKKYNLIAYPLGDLGGGMAVREAEIKFNPASFGLNRIDHAGEALYMSPAMGGDNQVYLDKVAEQVFVGIGDATTAATIICPQCSPLTGPAGTAAKVGELVYSDDKVGTLTSAAAGKGTALGTKRAAEKKGFSDMPIRRLEAAADYVGGKVASFLQGIGKELSE